jgi:hypothetical protein
LTYAFGQEVAAIVLCEEWLAELPSMSVADTLQAVSRQLYGRDASAEEIGIFEQHACTACTALELQRGICTALLGSQELLFY